MQLQQSIEKQFYIIVSVVAFLMIMGLIFPEQDLCFEPIALFLLGVMVWKTFIPMVRHNKSNMELLSLLQRVSSAANESPDIHEGFQAAIDEICHYTGWNVGHAFLYDEEKKRLLSMPTWFSSDDAKFRPFRNQSEGFSFKRGEGFLGEVFSDATPMWILDVAESSVYQRKEIAAQVGIRAAFAFPVVIGRKAVAVLEFYSDKAKIPDETLLYTMANVGKQLGQVVERWQFHKKALLLETVITTANDGIIITKADLSEAGPEIIYVNPAFTQITGYTAEDAIGKTPRFLQGGNTDVKTLKEISAALHEARPYKGEVLNYGKLGNSYWLDIEIVPVKDIDGKVTHFAAIERDITERKASEEHLCQTMDQLREANIMIQENLHRAEEANKAKSDFLANMSHELRTPMNGVLGMAQLLVDTKLDEEQRSYVSTINGSGETLLLLLNDILDLSKIEAGALELESIPYSISNCIQETTNLLHLHAEHKGVELMSEMESDIPAYIWGDQGRVRQVLINLIGNALKFTESGYVRVNASHDLDENYIRLYVEDTGIGIPEAKLKSIFEKFTQADASVTRRYGGTGLGLAISKQLVEMMGGKMGVESIENKGSTFWFTIPCQIASADDMDNFHSVDLQKQAFSENMKLANEAEILLVEDYHVNRIFAEKLLRKFGFEHIDVAENGMDAVRKYAQKKYDLIFMDCQMPELDGYQATEKIRFLEADSQQHIPIIAMTANAMMGDREKCLKAGMDDYISKPLKADYLRSLLNKFFYFNDAVKIVDISGNISSPEQMATEKEELPVNMEQLNMFTDGNKDDEAMLVNLFMTQAHEIISLLEHSIADDMQEEWKSASHRFKGASGNLGAMKLHHICKRAEQHYTDPQPLKEELLHNIRTELERVEKFFL